MKRLTKMQAETLLMEVWIYFRYTIPDKQTTIEVDEMFSELFNLLEKL